MYVLIVNVLLLLADSWLHSSLPHHYFYVSFSFFLLFLFIVFVWALYSLSIWIHIDDFSIHPYRSNCWVFLLPVVIYGCSTNISFIFFRFLFFFSFSLLFTVRFRVCIAVFVVVSIVVVDLFSFIRFLHRWCSFFYEIWITCAVVHVKNIIL